MLQLIGQGGLLLLVLMLTGIVAAALYGFAQLMGDFVRDLFRRGRSAISGDQTDTAPHGISPTHS